MKRKSILVVSTLILSGATYILGWSSLFTVSAVAITGTNNVVQPGIVKGERLARVEPREVSAKFEELDWVESAEVSRNWINGKVTIAIVERTPVAYFNNKVIDSKGNIFVARSTTSKNLIQVQAASDIDAVRAVKFLTALPDELTSQLQTIKVRSSGALVLQITHKGKNLEIRWGSNSDNELKFKVFKALIALPENAEIKRVDLSAPHAPIVK